MATLTTTFPQPDTQHPMTHGGDGDLVNKQKCTSATCCSPARLWRSIQTLIANKNKQDLMKLCQDGDKAGHVLRVVLSSRLSNDASRYPASHKHRVLQLPTTDNSPAQSAAKLGRSVSDLNALQLAMFHGQEAMAMYLVQWVHQQASAKETAQFLNHLWGHRNNSLHLACFLGMPRLAKLLLDLGVPVDAVNGKLKTPFDCCVEDQCRALVTPPPEVATAPSAPASLDLDCPAAVGSPTSSGTNVPATANLTGKKKGRSPVQKPGAPSTAALTGDDDWFVLRKSPQVMKVPTMPMLLPAAHLAAEAPLPFMTDEGDLFFEPPQPSMAVFPPLDQALPLYCPDVHSHKHRAVFDAIALIALFDLANIEGPFDMYEGMEAMFALDPVKTFDYVKGNFDMYDGMEAMFALDSPVGFVPDDGVNIRSSDGQLDTPNVFLDYYSPVAWGTLAKNRRPFQTLASMNGKMFGDTTAHQAERQVADDGTPTTGPIIGDDGSTMAPIKSGTTMACGDPASVGDTCASFDDPGALSFGDIHDSPTLGKSNVPGHSSILTAATIRNPPKNASCAGAVDDHPNGTGTSPGASTCTPSVPKGMTDPMKLDHGHPCDPSDTVSGDCDPGNHPPSDLDPSFDPTDNVADDQHGKSSFNPSDHGPGKQTGQPDFAPTDRDPGNQQVSTNMDSAGRRPVIDPPSDHGPYDASDHDFGNPNGRVGGPLNKQHSLFQKRSLQEHAAPPGRTVRRGVPLSPDETSPGKNADPMDHGTLHARFGHPARGPENHGTTPTPSNFDTPTPMAAPLVDLSDDGGDHCLGSFTTDPLSDPHNLSPLTFKFDHGGLAVYLHGRLLGRVDTWLPTRSCMNEHALCQERMPRTVSVGTT